MSFRLFVYYCGLCGAWAAFVGWILAKGFAPESALLSAMFQAMTLGIVLSLALSVVDGLWNGMTSGGLLAKAAVSVVIGGLGGLLGGFLGQALYSLSYATIFIILGWTVTGLLIGVAVGGYDLLMRRLRQESARGAMKKTMHGALGGTLGGLLGSLCFLGIRWALSAITGRPSDEMLSSSAVGFVALGACIGWLIALAQVILKEAWVRVEKGFRPGRELILTKPETIIGRSEGCDIGLYGAAGVEKIHARIIHSGNDYLLVDEQTAEGTYLNGQRIDGPTLLRAGDRIRVGDCELLFEERRKPASSAVPQN
ncbi:MAG: FHA domain-containing protein [Gemmatales bacterium]|nr:FHA domain-containing protein [Gemmatales bacterium]MDW8386549.1 FHA domain-containing protein [Gemmatales bacterium]